jgi:hypothetical protein
MFSFMLLTFLDTHRVDIPNIQGAHIRSDLNWEDKVNYTAQKPWKAFLFVMRVLKKDIGTQSLAYTSLVRPILEYGAAC